MKKVLVGAMALLVLAACSNEEVLQQNEAYNEIGFSAVTGKALSRAIDGYCNNSLPATFYVSASYAAVGSTYKQYFLNDDFKKGTGTTYVSDGSVRYWPDLTGGQKLKFFATTSTKPTTPDATAIKAPEWTDATCTAMKIADFEVGTDVSKQHDLLYAVQDVTTKPDGGLQSINFRHALSQIEFNARNENSNIRVEICGVSVVNVKDKGTFTFSESTDANVDIHDPSGSYPAVVGEWSGLANPEQYDVTFDPVNVLTTATSLTTKDPSVQEYNTNTMYLIPQGITPWDPETYADPDKDYGGTKGINPNGYFLVKAKIWNIADKDHGYKDSDVLLWGTDKTSMSATGAKDIAIPIPYLTTNPDGTHKIWEAGKRYVYTFVFTTTGMGGLDPDPSNPDDPQNVLIPIKLDITVDDFVDETGKDVPMAKE